MNAVLPQSCELLAARLGFAAGRRMNEVLPKSCGLLRLRLCGRMPDERGVAEKFWAAAASSADAE